MNYRITGFFTEQDRVTPIERPVAFERFGEVVRSKRICLLVLALEEKFQLVIENYSEWEAELLKQAQEYAVWAQFEHSPAMERRLVLDRRFLNLLSSFRLYLDQTAHAISECCGDSSSEFQQLRKFKADLYDAHVSYRVVEALRNHVQHRDLAIHSISFNNGTVWTEQGPLNAFSVVPFIHVEQLRDDDGFKASTLKELEVKGTRFDVRSDVRIYVDCIAKIRDEVVRLLKPGATTARSTYEAACREFWSHEGKELGFAALEEVDDTGIAKRVVHLATEFLARHDEIVGRNSKLLRHKFAASFVHSAVDKLPSNEQAIMRALTQRSTAPTPPPSPPDSP